MIPAAAPGLSVLIPTYRRSEILQETLRHLLALPENPFEILVVDQTENPPPEILGFFQILGNGFVRRIALDRPSIPHAMNVGLREARGEIVLFLDDDIIPDRQLISNHWKTHAEFPEAAAVVGQVLYPEEIFQRLEEKKPAIS